MKIEDILADEVIKLGGAVRFPVFIKIKSGLLTQILETGHVADRRIEPDIEILARRIGNLETKIRRIA